MEPEISQIRIRRRGRSLRRRQRSRVSSPPDRKPARSEPRRSIRWPRRAGRVRRAARTGSSTRIMSTKSYSRCSSASSMAPKSLRRRRSAADQVSVRSERSGSSEPSAAPAAAPIAVRSISTSGGGSPSQAGSCRWLQNRSKARSKRSRWVTLVVNRLRAAARASPRERMPTACIDRRKAVTSSVATLMPRPRSTRANSSAERGRCGAATRSPATRSPTTGSAPAFQALARACSTRPVTAGRTDCTSS